MNIVDCSGLSEILKIEPRTLRELWREFPHFFAGQGKDARSARFDAGDVIRYLKEKNYKGKDYEHLVRREKETLENKVLDRQ